MLVRVRNLAINGNSCTIEEKVSGGIEFDDLDKREALMAAIEALESGMALVVAKRDRLARNVASAAIIEREHSVILTPHREAFYNREKRFNPPIGKDSPWAVLRLSR